VSWRFLEKRIASSFPEAKLDFIRPVCGPFVVEGEAVVVVFWPEDVAPGAPISYTDHYVAESVEVSEKSSTELWVVIWIEAMAVRIDKVAIPTSSWFVFMKKGQEVQ
jgi:hypothetical protein